MDDNQSMEADANRLKKGRTDVFILFALVFVAVVVFAIVIILYRWKIGGSFSTDPNDWSIFGAYVGGVLGPLVSFLTLIAILVTITLQRQLLLLQEKEFSALYKLQIKTFDSQRLQALGISNEAERSRKEDCKNSLLKSIERLDLNTIRDIQRLESTRSKSMDSLKHCVTDSAISEVSTGIDKLSHRIDELELRKMSLDSLMIEFTLNEYESVAQLKTRFQQAIQCIYPKT